MSGAARSQAGVGAHDDRFSMFGSLVASAEDWVPLCCTFRRLLGGLGAEATRLYFLNTNCSVFTTFDPTGRPQKRFESLHSQKLKGSKWSVEHVAGTRKALLMPGLHLMKTGAPKDYIELTEHYRQRMEDHVCCLSVPIMKEGGVIGVVTMVMKMRNSSREAYEYVLSRVDMLVTLFGSLLPGRLMGDMCRLVWEIQEHRTLNEVVGSCLGHLWNQFPVMGVKLALFDCRLKVGVVFGLQEDEDGRVDFSSGQDEFFLDWQTAAARMLYNPGALPVDCREALDSMKDVQIVKNTTPATRMVLVIPLETLDYSEPLPHREIATPSGGSQQGLELGLTLGLGMGNRSGGWERLCGALYLAGPRLGIFDSCLKSISSCSRLISWKLQEKLQKGLAEELQAVAAQAHNALQERMKSRGNAEEEQNLGLWIRINQLQNQLFELSRSGKSLQTLRIDKYIGEGTHGLVFSGWWQGTIAAVKIFPSARGHKAALKLATEVGIVSMMTHPNIVRTFTSMVDLPHEEVTGIPGFRRAPAQQGTNSGHPQVSIEQSLVSKWGKELMERYRWNILVMEHCDRKNLEEEIHGGGTALRNRDGSANIGVLISIACEIAYALQHLHSQNIIHGDLKPGNILLLSSAEKAKGFTVKVTDFGTSRILDGGRPQSTTMPGTLAYMPPEVISASKGRTVSIKLDVYSFGIILWEMYAGEVPYKGMHSAQIQTDVCAVHLRPSFGSGCPGDYMSLAKQCWDANESKRPTFDEILQELKKMGPRHAAPDQLI